MLKRITFFQIPIFVARLPSQQRSASMNRESRRIETKRKQVFPLLNRIALIAANKAISIFIMHTGCMDRGRY